MRKILLLTVILSILCSPLKVFANESPDGGYKGYTEEEYILLASIIYCEAGNQIFDGKIAVGNVVLNRVASDQFPNDINSVVYQENQFSPVKDGALEKALKNNLADETCFAAAREAIDGTDIVGQCLYFHRTYGEDDGLIIGDHVFYEEYWIK